MLKKQNRLKKERDFKKILKEGRGLRQKNIFFKFLINDLGESRFGFVVSKKISNKAVVRNRVKRRMREAVHNAFPGIKVGVDGAFIALEGIEEDSFQEIEETIMLLLKRAGITE